MKKKLEQLFVCGLHKVNEMGRPSYFFFLKEKLAFSTFFTKSVRMMTKKMLSWELVVPCILSCLSDFLFAAQPSL